MGQKTNPILLRLEKTNQQHKSCWFSNRYYAWQLHKNLQVLDYVKTIVTKEKKLRKSKFYRRKNHSKKTAIIYAKAGFGFNQLYITKVITNKRKKFAQNRLSVVKKNLSRNPRYVTPVYKRPKKYIPLLNLLAQKKLSHKGNSHQKIMDFHTFFSKDENLNQQNHQLCVSKENKLYNSKILFNDKIVTTYSFFATYLRCVDLLEYYYPASDSGRLKARLRQKNLKHLAAHIDGRSHLISATGLKENTLFGARQDTLIVTPKDHGILRNLETEKYTTKDYSNLVIRNTYKNTKFTTIKLKYFQQSCEFLANKVANGIRNRHKFGRIRQHIIGDLMSAPYVRGIRVTISGRAESRSKKAQKARTLCFSWGLMELNVFSSKVQFVKKDVLTRFGKTNIKMWLCFK